MRCPCRSPFGSPVEPDVYMRRAGSSGPVDAYSTPPWLRREAGVESAFTRLRVARHQHVFQRGEPGSCVTHAAPGLRVGDHDPRAGVCQAVLDGVRSVELREGHHHRAQLVDREVGEGGLRPLPGVYRHRLAGPDSQGEQALREAVGEGVQLRERVAPDGGVVVFEDEGGMVPARAACMGDHGVQRNVGVLRDPDAPCIARRVVVEVGPRRDGGEDRIVDRCRGCHVGSRSAMLVHSCDIRWSGG